VSHEEDIRLSNVYFRAAGLGLKEAGWLDANGARALYEDGRASREAEIAALKAELDSLRAAARQVPIVRRANQPPFSVCLGCGAQDGDPCVPPCWVSSLERAIDGQ